MSIKIGDLSKEVREISFVFADETVNLSYKVGKYTGEAELRLSEAQTDKQPVNGLVNLLDGLLVSWDVLEDDGKQMAVTVENLRRLPVNFLAEMTNAITEDMRPNAVTASQSRGGSFQE
jgi:hypothetical protein